MTSGLTVWMYVFNSSRPLFKDNPQLRRAVNLALNRTEFAIRGAETFTDQLVPPQVPGYRDHGISPREGDLGRAKALARGHLRDGKAVLYTPGSPLKIGIAQSLQLQLAEIGLDVEIRDIPEFVTNPTHIAAGSATPARPGTWLSSSGRPTSSTRTATSTDSSTRSRPAARTWPASTSRGIST